MNVSVLDYGAKCDGALQTQAFQTAIDACFLAGDGEVTVDDATLIQKYLANEIDCLG